MASTAIETPISDHRLHAESLPVIDLRLLSQSELHALSLTSSSSTVDLRRCDDVVVPTIDRSVFNESAGSRKQTYSRLRLAPRKPQTVPSSSSSSSNTIPRPIHPRSHLVNGVESEENRKIVSLLKDLLSGEGCRCRNEKESDELVPVRVEYGDSVPKSSNVVLQQVAVDVVVDGGGAVKKRRGRKPKNDEMALVVYENPVISNEDKDRVIVNDNGVLVDISALANLEDPFGPELKRKTEGMTTDEELLGFITGLAGQWGSRRKRRKTVEASGFGDALPKGWKLLLSIKKKDGIAWLNCRRYISPSGREFVSCKEISSYLLSLFGQEARVLGHKDESNHLAYGMSSGNDTQQVAAFSPKENEKLDDITSLTPTAIASLSADCKNQVALLREGQVLVKGTLTCHKCATPFEEEDDLLHHLLTAHIKSGKRRRLGTSVSDGVIIKDGVFECQFCHKIFHEKHRYNGHVGNHVKNYVKNLEASSGVMTMPMNVEPVSVGGFLHSVDEIKTPILSPIDATAEPSNSRVEECPSSDSCHNKFLVSSIVETCTKDNNQERLPHDMQNGKRKKKKKAMDKESSDNAGKKHKIDNNKQPKVDVSAGVAVTQLTSSLGVETSLSMNENQNIHEKFDEPNLTKFTNDARVELEQNYDSSLLAFSGNVKTSLAEGNMNGVSPTLMKAPKQDLGSESASVVPNVNEILFGTESISDGLIYNTTEEPKIVNPEQIVNDGPSIASGNTGPDENVVSGFKQREGSDVFSFDSSLTEPKRDVTNITTAAESKNESGSERGAPPPFDGLSSGIDIDINTARSNTLDQPNFDLVERELSASPYDGQSSGFNINMNIHTTTLEEPDFDAAERGLSAPPYDGQSSGFNINMNSVHTSTLDEPDFDIDERGLSTPPYDGQSPGFNINMNSVRNSTLDEPDYEIIDSSGIKELTFDFGNNDARPDQNDETSFEQERSSESRFPLMSSNQQTSHLTDNRMGVSAGRMEDFCMGKVGNIVSPSTVEELDLVDKDLWKNELIMSLGGNQRGLEVGVMPNFDQKKVSGDCTFNLPRNDQRFMFENNFIEARHNSIENLSKGNISETHLLNQSRKKQKNEARGKKVLTSPREKLKSNEIRNSWSSELIMGLGNSQAGQHVDINRNFAGHSIDYARNNHPYGVQNNVTGICNNPVQMHAQENAFRSNLFSPFSNDQLFGVDNNPKRFHPDTVWEEQRLGNLQSSRTSDHMMGFNSSLPRPVENVMNDATWRANTQNILPTGLADSSLPMAHSSNCFAPFDFISHKGDNEYLSTSEKFDNISGFEGMQSNSYEQMEYNFFTPQTNAPAGSSLWLEKEAMITKTVNRNQFIVICMWCGNEFPLEGFNSGTQTGSMGYICPTCKTKISGQLNVL